MAKEGPPPVHIEFTARQIEDGKERKALFIVTAGHVDVSVPDPIVGQMTRDEARALGEALLGALDESPKKVGH